MSSTPIPSAPQRFDWARARGIAQSWAIWALLLGTLYVLRGFWTLLFVTFIFAYLMNSVAGFLARYMPSYRRVRIVLAFLAFLGTLTLIGWYLIPVVKVQAAKLYESAQGYAQDLQARARKEPEKNIVSHIAADLPEGLQRFVGPTLQSEPVNQWIEEEGLPQIPHLLTRALQGLVFFLLSTGTILLLATLFSFLILLDLPRLQDEIAKLRRTRLRSIFEHASGPIVKMGEILGKTFQAQAIIALCNTGLTGVLLALLGIPNLSFLLFIVFFFSFIPVAGVFISSVPICLIGLREGGLQMVFLLIATITFVHMVEGYVLNPRIMGAALHMNPVLVLAILTIGGKLLGPWGLILGVPACYFVFAHAIWDKEPGKGSSPASLPEPTS